MADIEAAPAPAAPRKESAARRVVAGVAAHPRELLALTARAVVLCFASAVSVNNADLIASSWACGLEGVPGVLVLALFVPLGLALVPLFAAIAVIAGGLVLLNVAVLLSLLWSRCRRGSSNPEAGKIGGDGGAKRPSAQRRCSYRTGAGDGDDDRFTAPAVFLFKAVALGLLLLLSAPANGYCGERVCSMLTDIRCLPYSVNALLRRLVELVPTQRYLY